jgi:hypothetical protein
MNQSIPETLTAQLDEIEQVNPDRAIHLRGEYARALRWNDRRAIQSVAQEIHDAHAETARQRARMVGR